MSEEFHLREIGAHVEATEAQKIAARAEEVAANANVEDARTSRVNPWLMLGSVIVAFVAAIPSACSANFAYRLRDITRCCARTRKDVENVLGYIPLRVDDGDTGSPLQSLAQPQRHAGRATGEPSEGKA